MALNSSGPLSLGGATTGQSVNLELSKSATALVTMNDTDLRSLFGVSSGQISMSSGYGKSAINYSPTVALHAVTLGPEFTGVPTPNVAAFQYHRYIFNHSSGTVTDENYSTPQTFSGFDNNVGVHATNYGWHLGGSGGSVAVRTAFSNYAVTTSSFALPAIPAGSYEMNSLTDGYLADSDLGGQKFNFATETSVGYSASQLYPAVIGGSSHSTTKGYIAGGTNGDTYYPTTTMKTLTFSSDTSAMSSASLGTARRNLAGLNYASTRGYYAGGQFFSPGSNPSVPAVNEIDGVAYATDSSYNIGAGMIESTQGYHKGHSGPAKGQWIGGYKNGGYRNTVDSVNFSTDASARESWTAYAAYGPISTTSIYSMGTLQNSNS